MFDNLLKYFPSVSKQNNLKALTKRLDTVSSRQHYKHLRKSYNQTDQYFQKTLKLRTYRFTFYFLFFDISGYFTGIYLYFFFLEFFGLVQT